MTPGPSISEAIERQSVVSMECTVPADMTLDEWRRNRPARRRSVRRRRTRVVVEARFEAEPDLRAA